jgi:hypothetical protein
MRVQGVDFQLPYQSDPVKDAKLDFSLSFACLCLKFFSTLPLIWGISCSLKPFATLSLVRGQKMIIDFANLIHYFKPVSDGFWDSFVLILHTSATLESPTLPAQNFSQFSALFAEEDGIHYSMVNLFDGKSKIKLCLYYSPYSTTMPE